MSELKYGVCKVTGSNGDICLSSGIALDPFVTFCGDCDIIDHDYEVTNSPLTCNTCKNAFNLLRHGIKILTKEDKECE